MKQIKTKEFVDAQEVLDTASDLGDRMRKALLKTTNSTKALSEDNQGSSTEYAANNLQYAAEDLTYDAGHIAVDTAKRTSQGIRNIIGDMKEHRNHPETAPPAQPSIQKQTKTRHTNPIPKPKTSVNQTQSLRKTAIKQSAQSAEKGVIKTAKRTVKDSRRMEKVVKEATGNTIKTTKAAAKTAKESARAAAETSRKTAWIVHRTIKLAAQAVKTAAQLVVKAAKAVAAVAKSIAAAIASGGWLILLVIAVIIIILVIIMAVLGYVDPTVPNP